MKLVKQKHEIISLPENLLEALEKAGRVCYKSEDKITKNSAPKFVKMLIDAGHHAMIEFGDIIVKFVTNRGVTHELVRHRLCSFAQESTRYVKYKEGIKCIIPVWSNLKEKEYFLNHQTHGLEKDNELFIQSCLADENYYRALIDLGWKAEQAREVLPNALKTEIVVKGNIRQWRHIFNLRYSPKAHPQIKALMEPLLAELQHKLPVVFDDIVIKN